MRLLVNAGDVRRVKLEPLLRTASRTHPGRKVTSQCFLELRFEVGGVMIGILNPPGRPLMCDIDFIDAIPAIEAVFKARVAYEIVWLLGAGRPVTGSEKQE